MSKHIFEELPTRKHAPAAAPAAAAKGGDKGKQKGGTEENSEKRVRQAVYDIRYRARREGIDLKAAYSQYMANSSLNQAEKTAVRDKLFGKKGGMSEQYSTGGDDLAVNSVAGALYKVFVEQVHKEEKIELAYEKKLDEEMKERKYKVRVTDPKNNRSYVRYATREKITQLRARGLKVEMTEYGEPYEGERNRGENTARALGGGKKKLDPVGKEDADVDNDGKPNDKNDKYIMKRRAAIGKAIEMRKEDYLWNEGTTSTEGQNAQKIDVMKKGEVNNVKVFPQDSSDTQSGGGIIQAGNEMEGPFLTEKAKSKAQQRFMALVYKKKKEGGEASPEVEAAAKGMTKKEAKKFAKTKHKGLPEKMEEAVSGGGAPNVPAPVAKFVDELPQNLQRAIQNFRSGAAKPKPTAKPTRQNTNEEIMGICPKCGKCPCECENGERDTRADKTYRDLLKNKLRAMGIKNPIMLDAPTDEKEVMKIMTSSSAKMNSEGYDSRYGRGERGEPKATEILKLSPKAQEKYDAMMKELKAKSNLKGV